MAPQGCNTLLCFHDGHTTKCLTAPCLLCGKGVHCRLRDAFEKGQIKLGTSMCTMIGRSLTESCRGVDILLLRWGKNILRGKGEYGPFTSEEDKAASARNSAKIFTERLAKEGATRDAKREVAYGVNSEWYNTEKPPFHDAMKRVAELQTKAIMKKYRE